MKRKFMILLFIIYGAAAAYDYYLCGTTAMAWGVLAVVAFGFWMEAVIEDILKRLKNDIK
jgi:hypothetical protein